MLILDVQRHHHHCNGTDGATHNGRTCAEGRRHAAAYIQCDFDALARGCDVLKGELECFVECCDDVGVGRPYETAFVSCAFLVGQHRNEDVVWMDFGALDVVGVSDAVADVFGEWGSAGGNDADFRGAEFAKIAYEGC